MKIKSAAVAEKPAAEEKPAKKAAKAVKPAAKKAAKKGGSPGREAGIGVEIMDMVKTGKTNAEIREKLGDRLSADHKWYVSWYRWNAVRRGIVTKAFAKEHSGGRSAKAEKAEKPAKKAAKKASKK